MGRLFGTDGVRGVANADLTADLALSLSGAAVSVLTRAGGAVRPRPLVVVGRDTRPSGEFLEAAVIAGLAAAGADVLRMGVVPTPAVAFGVVAAEADLGVVLSASHNAMPDNGIKLFASGGFKLPDELEDQIEAHLGQAVGPADRRRRRPDSRRARRCWNAMSSTCWHAVPARARRSADRCRLRAGRGVLDRPEGAAPGRGRGHPAVQRRQRDAHQPGVRRDPSRGGEQGGGRGRGRRRYRLRRGRRPLPCRGRRRQRRRRRPDPCDQRASRCGSGARWRTTPW